MRIIYTIIILLIVAQTYTQNAVVIENYQGKKYPETTWGADNKHFGHYQIRYVAGIPLPNGSDIENSIASGSWAFGYQYRFKIADKFDFGTELAFENNFSAIRKDQVSKFTSSGSFNKLRTYQNGFSGSVFGRIILKDNTIRNLGWHVDIGAFGAYYPYYGLFMKSDNEELKIRVREKKPDYLMNYDYGVFLRAGKNNIMLYLNYSLSDWIIDLNSDDYYRSALRVGIQLNLYAK